MRIPLLNRDSSTVLDILDLIKTCINSFIMTLKRYIYPYLLVKMLQFLKVKSNL